MSRCRYNVTGELQRAITEDSFLFFRESDDLERLQMAHRAPRCLRTLPPSTKVSKMGIKSPLRLHRHKRASGGSFANSCNPNCKDCGIWHPPTDPPGECLDRLSNRLTKIVVEVLKFRRH